jgi:hypothetical protein
VRRYQRALQHHHRRPVTFSPTAARTEAKQAFMDQARSGRHSDAAGGAVGTRMLLRAIFERIMAT